MWGFQLLPDDEEEGDPGDPDDHRHCAPPPPTAEEGHGEGGTAPLSEVPVGNDLIAEGGGAQAVSGLGRHFSPPSFFELFKATTQLTLL